jgi:hypothetical protein
MSVLSLFEALGETALGQFLKDSTIAFALTEAGHLIALSLLGGIVAAVGLSASGILLSREWAAPLAKALRRAFVLALLVVILTGTGLVAAGPYKYYTNPVFWVKIGLLAVALIAYVGLDRALARPGKGARIGVRILGGIVVLLWLLVAIAGRGIGLI